MGWSGGADLMSDIIVAINNHSGENDKTNFYRDVINAFKSLDCDTLDECLGYDESYDKAYYLVFPHHK